MATRFYLVLLAFVFINCSRAPFKNNEAEIELLEFTINNTIIKAEIDNLAKIIRVGLPIGSSIPESVAVSLVKISVGATGIKSGNVLSISENTSKISIISENEKLVKKFTINYYVKTPPPNTEAAINSLMLTIDSEDFTVNFTGSRGVVSLTYGSNFPTRATVKSVTLSEGAIGLSVGDLIFIDSNVAMIIIQSEDTLVRKIHTVSFVQEINTAANIESLSLTLLGNNYSATITGSIASIHLPTGSLIPSSAVVKTVSLSNGASGITVNQMLTISSNQSEVTITAEDTTTTKTYTIKFVNILNNLANITSLTITLNSENYPVTFSPTRTASIVLPFGNTLPMQATVETTTIPYGATGLANSDTLSILTNAITITITAEDTTTINIYTINITVETTSSSTNYSNLKFTINSIDYAPVYTNYINLPASATIPSTILVKSITLAHGATGIAVNDVLNVTISPNGKRGRVARVTITAHDGTVKNIDFIINKLVLPANIYDFTINSKSYSIINDARYWDEAVDYAKSINAKLVEIKTVTLQNAIVADITSSGFTFSETAADGGGGKYIWIGATDGETESRWVWDGDNNNQANTIIGNGNSTAWITAPGAYENWGTISGMQNEPDDFGAMQDRGAISLDGWPLGSVHEWNDINNNNNLPFIIQKN